MNNQESELQYLSFSETGTIKAVNTDYLLSFEGSFGKLFIVAEGVGLNGGGDVASQLAVVTIKEHFQNLSSVYSVIENLKTALFKANNAIIEFAISHHCMTGIGCSCAIILVRNQSYWNIVLGDSKIFRIYNNEITIIKENMKNENEYKKKNEETLNIIGVPNLKLTVNGPYDLFENEFFALVSNSFSHHITRYELKQAFEFLAFDKLKKYLIELALKRSLKDNFSFIGIKVLTGKKYLISDIELKHENNKLYFSLLFFLLSSILFLNTFLPLIENSFQIFKKEQRMPAFQEMFNHENQSP